MAAILISVGVITCENLACNKGGVHIGGMQHRYRNDSTRFRKACIFTTHKALRENTCPIASGDYSTPVSQRAHFHPLDLLQKQIYPADVTDLA